MAEELFEAIKQGDLERVRTLVEARPVLAAACEQGGVSAVLTALYHHKPDVSEYLLSKGPPLDIFEASAAGDAGRVAELLDADPTLLDAYAPDGFHPLGLAAFFRRGEVVRLLLERGADVAQASRNRLAVTPLHSAVADEADRVDLETVRMLLEAGAPVDAPHQGGGTPLHSAAHTGALEVAGMLLAKGADPLRPKDDGKTPLDVARERGHADVARLLEKAIRSSARA